MGFGDVTGDVGDDLTDVGDLVAADDLVVEDELDALGGRYRQIPELRDPLVPAESDASASNIDGPTGSSTFASAAKLSTQACLSRASTNSRERRPATTAGWFSRSMFRYAGAVSE